MKERPCDLCKREGKHYGDCPEHLRAFLVWWWRDDPRALRIALRREGLH